MSDALTQSALELCVMAMLSQRDSSAYDVAGRLTAAMGVSEGAVYPLMRRLQTAGLVAAQATDSSSGPPRRLYRLTDAGKADLITRKAAWTSVSRAVHELLGDAP